jgi:hypothetical protein
MYAPGSRTLESRQIVGHSLIGSRLELQRSDHAFDVLR